MQTYGDGTEEDGASVESDLIKNAANRRGNSSSAVPGAGASQMADLIRRLEERSLAQQRGLQWAGEMGSEDDIEEADAEDDSAGGEDDGGDSDAHSSFIDDSDLKEMASRNQQLARSNLLQGDWFVIAANKTLQHEVVQQQHPPSAPKAAPGPAMDKRLAKREKARRSFIHEHADEAAEWKANMSRSTASALQALEAAASSRPDCPFTPNWSAKSVGILRAPEWPHDLDEHLSALDEAVCGAEETPLVGQPKRAHRTAGYTAVLLSHSVPFSEQEIKRNLKRLQSVRLVRATWLALQRALSPLVQGSLAAGLQPAAALRAHICLGNYCKALKKHRANLRQKERSFYSEVFAGVTDAQVRQGSIPQPELLGLSLLQHQAQSTAQQAMRVSVASVPEDADTEDFVFNPRTTKFWEEAAVQHKALQRQLQALLQERTPSVGGSSSELEALQADTVVLAQANQLDAADAPSSSTAAAAPVPLPLPVAHMASAAAELHPSTPVLLPVAAAAGAGSATKPSTASHQVSYGPNSVFGHFARTTQSNSVLVLPGTHGQEFCVPSIPDLTKAMLEQSADDGASHSISAAQHELLAVTQQNRVRTWANFKQPPPMSLDELRAATRHPTG